MLPFHSHLKKLHSSILKNIFSCHLGNNYISKDLNVEKLNILFNIFCYIQIGMKLNFLYWFFFVKKTPNEVWSHFWLSPQNFNIENIQCYTILWTSGCFQKMHDALRLKWEPLASRKWIMDSTETFSRIFI